MPKAPISAPVSTAQTVTAYAVLPGPNEQEGWTVVKFKVELPVPFEQLYVNTSRALAAVTVSQLHGRDALAMSPDYSKGE